MGERGAQMYLIGQAPHVTPIEEERQQSLPLAERWDLYCAQRGRSWSYFLTKQEYDSYLVQFTFIRDRLPSAYRAALRSRDEYEKLRVFSNRYQRLNTAAFDASLQLDRQGNLALEVRPESFVKIVSDATANAIINEVGGHLATWILGADILGPLGLLLDLSQLYRSIQNEKLVGAVGQEAEQARFRKKLSLIMDIMAADIAKRTRTNPAELKIRLRNLYNQYQAAWYQYSRFVELNRRSDPNQPQQPPGPTVGPVSR
jgi:hypothetical protein